MLFHFILHLEICIGTPRVSTRCFHWPHCIWIKYLPIQLWCTDSIASVALHAACWRTYLGIRWPFLEMLKRVLYLVYSFTTRSCGEVELWVSKKEERRAVHWGEHGYNVTEELGLRWMGEGQEKGKHVTRQLTLYFSSMERIEDICILEVCYTFEFINEWMGPPCV